MDCREDVKKFGAEILGRELTKEELDELTMAMETRYDLYCEMYDEDVDREDVKKFGAEILGRELTKEELDELNNIF